jgi:hypothetical protein
MWRPCLAFSFLLAGCSQPSIESVRVVTDPDVPGVATITWTSTESGPGSVFYGLNGGTHRSPTGPPSTEHSIELRGLKQGRDYTFTPMVHVGGEDVEGPTKTLTSPAATWDLPQGELITHDESLTCGNGYILVSFLRVAGESWVGIVDRDGDFVWAMRGDPDVWQARVRPGIDQNSLLWLTNDPSRQTDVGSVVRVPFAGGERTVTPALNAHHDFIEHDDGTLGWLSYAFEDGMELDGEVHDVAADVIYETPEGTAEPTRTVFNMFEDYPHPMWYSDAFEPNWFVPGYYEFSHGNSLMFRDDSYFVMFRWLDAMIRVDRSSGDMLWQFGGAHNDFAGNPDDLFSHAHMSEVWDGGLLLFDNADGTGRVSGVVEYALDETAMTYEKVWEYRDPEDRFEALLGDARRIPNCDNKLVAWSTQGRIAEVTGDGQIAWELQMDEWVIGRLLFLEDLYSLQ